MSDRRTAVAAAADRAAGDAAGAAGAVRAAGSGGAVGVGAAGSGGAVAAGPVGAGGAGGGAGSGPGDLGEGGLEALLESHRVELTGYCYRMLGSAFEAEDAVQETLVRAWRGFAGFEGRAAVRSWLYRIATNVCLDMLRGRGRRAHPMDLASPVSADAPLPEALPEVTWISPAPDGRVLPEGGDPAELAVARESVRLAFVAALQLLAPRQRAVLILREVLAWKAAEVAELLGTTVASVNSALQRARATLAARGTALGPAAGPTAGPAPDATPAAAPVSGSAGVSGTARARGIAGAPGASGASAGGRRGAARGGGSRGAAALDGPSRALLDRYVDAFEAYDLDALTALLREDAALTMPPYGLWLRGPEDIRGWLSGPGHECRGSRLVPAAANGTAAFGQYRPSGPGGRHEPWSLQVVEVSADGRISGLHAFLDTARLFPLFGLPDRPDRPD
ncbi:sigma-70 family RNA polymerase sigma factor [Streptomyces sp. B1866]|uniref:sigma-70 family RNA polymerase sigma factor n=1 Tax=Streptomyces sp. B1866 TaxID=3075431 RepID=UPI0028912283|nr:sigma-70 family RNA polymerase sigma factor [Streptomyces sp. B1866]MDT3398359.1 sigma-70 family RNA polymerase sigma factor [Streptomyces sp. B1866]